MTGAAGWFGRALLAALTDPSSQFARDGEIRALVRDRAEADDLAALPKVVPVVGDVRGGAGWRTSSPGSPGRSTWSTPPG